MPSHRCAACSHDCTSLSRREFVGTASAVSLSMLAGLSLSGTARGEKITQAGPASKYVPTVKAAFVRRKGEYGIRWPGQIYDGAAALKKYTAEITAAAKELKLKLDLRGEPLYTMAESQSWLAEAAAAKPDGLLVVLLDRQEHAWPTAGLAIDTQIPTVIFSPVGSSFTTNTTVPSQKTGCFIASTDDFSQVKYGLKMLHAGAKMHRTRCLVIAGKKRADTEMAHLGIQLRHIPAQTFLDEYQKTPTSDEIKAMAAELIQGATR